MEEQQGTQQPDFIPIGATPDFIPAEESPKPVTTWSAFKSLMPGGKDLVHAAGFPTSRQEAEEMQRAEAGKSGWQKTKEALAAGIPGTSFLPAMGKEAWRAAKGTVQGDPMAPVHALSALNPFAAPVVSQMTEQGLGTKEANATGVVGAGTLAAGEVAPRVVPPVVRGVARGTNAVLEKAPGTIDAGVGAALAHEVGVPPWVGGGAGYALGRELLPKLRIPGERFGLPKTDQLSLFRNTPKLGNTPPSNPLAVTNPALPREITPAEAPAPTPAPLKAKTLAGQNAEVLKRSGIAGPKSTLKPLAEIPKGELTPDPHYDFQHVRSGEQAITQQISSHPLNKLRAIATQRGIKVAPSDTNRTLIQKISDSATPAEIDAFEQARVERMHPNYAPSPRNGGSAVPATPPALSRARQMQVAGEGMPLKRPATAEEQAWTDAMANFGSREGPPGVEGPPLTPRVPRSDTEMEDLLRRSIRRK